MIYFLNFGHANTPHEADDEVVRENVVLHLLDPSNPNGVLEAVLEVLPTKAEWLREAITRRARIVVGLPGATLLAVALVRVLDGLLGFCPEVVVATRTDVGYVYNLRSNFRLDPDQARNAGRSLRVPLQF